MVMTQLLAECAELTRDSQIDSIFQLIMGRSDIASYAAGAPDRALLPVAMLPQLLERALDRYGSQVLQYGSPQGFPPLRQACAVLLSERGVDVDANDVHVATGGSGGLDTLRRTLVDPGDVILVERPTYAEALNVFRAYRARVEEIDCDGHGMNPARPWRIGSVAGMWYLVTFSPLFRIRLGVPPPWSGGGILRLY